MSSSNEIYKILSDLYFVEDFTGMINSCNIELDKGSQDYRIYGARGLAYMNLAEYEKAILYQNESEVRQK